MLTGNSISDDGVKNLFQSFSQLKNLEILHINLDWNFNISDTAVEHISQQITSLKKLQKLRLFCSQHTLVSSSSNHFIEEAVNKL